MGRVVYRIGKKLFLAVLLTLYLGSLEACADPEPLREDWAQNDFAGQAALEKADWPEAERRFRIALDNAEKLKSSGCIGIALLNLARTFHGQRRFEEAERYYKKALKVYEGASRKNSFTSMYAIREYARLLRETKRNAEADKLEAAVKRRPMP